MKLWIKILAGLLPGAATILVLFFIFFLRRRRQLRQRQRQQQLINTTISTTDKEEEKSFHFSFKTNLAGFHHLHHHHDQQKHPIHNQHPQFNWNDNPRLISDAVENGWSRFAFSGRSSQPRSPLLGLCGNGRRQREVEINWEVPSGSSDFMQTVRINPGGGGGGGGDDNSFSFSFSCCCVRMGLPLPGPPLGGSSFPQEAYFEIAVLYLQSQVHHRFSRAKKEQNSGCSEGDRTKLIESDALVHGKTSPIQELKRESEEDGGEHGEVVISLGLTGGGSQPNKMVPVPGTYPGSIGFNSDGSVYLNGIKLVFESEKREWGVLNSVIGCGFNPSKKKVFFTVDSELVHVIHCNSDTFKNPLYPVLAVNSDLLVLVNLGQSAFRYEPANVERTPNPCFLRPSPNDPSAAVSGYEDSRELFSMGRIDSQWLDGTRKSRSHGSNTSNSSSKNSDCDRGDNGSIVEGNEVESDLFEIALHS